MVDIHVHSNFSSDSVMSIRDIYLETRKKGLSGVCLSDHIDSIQDQILNYDENIDKLFFEVEGFRNEVADGTEFFVGFEFSEPHKNQKMYEHISKYDFDYRMCTIHHNKNGIYPHAGVVEKEKFVNEYLDEVNKMVESVEFDILGHFDLPRKYFGSFDYKKDKIVRLFAALKKKDVVLELNTSVYKAGIDLCYLKEYISCGNKKIVLGSDAHTTERIGEKFDELLSVIPKGLEIGHFKSKKFICDFVT